MHVIPLSRSGRFAAAALVLLVVGTAAFLLLRYSALPGLLPVHFRRGGVPDGWQYKTMGRVLIPVIVQAVLTLSMGSIAVLLLSRSERPSDPGAPDVLAAAAAAETILFIALIWVCFQSYTAWALLRVWVTGRGALGPGYTGLEVTGLLLTGTVAARGYARVGRPVPRPYVPHHWRLGQLYNNADDPALFVPTRDGSRWTLNFGRPVAVALLSVVLLLGVVGPTIALILALRFNF